MKKILLALMLSSPAFAEVPPPGTSRKGPITVHPHYHAKPSEYDLKTHKVIPRSASRGVQKKLDDLRTRVRELEAENERLRNQPIPVAGTIERVIEIETFKPRPHTVYAMAGVMPDGLHVENGDLSRRGDIHEHGSAIGAGYMYHVNDRVSVGGAAAVTTRSTHLTSFFGTLGYSFGD